MTIESRTDSQLVLRQPRPAYAGSDSWPYIVAILMALLFGILSSRAWFEHHIPHEAILYAVAVEVLICAAVAGFGVWLDWIHAEFICRLDKTQRLLTVERVTPRFRQTIQYALDELQKVDLQFTDYSDGSTTYAIRFRFGGTRAVRMRKSRRQHEQDLAISAIRQFLKHGAAAARSSTHQ